MQTFSLKMKIALFILSYLDVLLILSYLENQIVKIPSIETLNASIEYILLTERYNNPLF